MSYKTIDIPGGSTRFEDSPVVQIRGIKDGPVEVIIKYHARETTGGRPPLFGVITFTNVLEYRWTSDVIEYYPYNDSENIAFGLIQILDSKHIKDIVTKGPWHSLPNKRFGPNIEESEVKHFRLIFDEYGQFDVIALGISVGESSE
ncbi:MAG: hypothetical protein ACJ8CR_09635 [Roseiflexaceae bacterium]